MKANRTSPRTTSNLRKHFLQLATVLCLALGTLAPVTARAVAPSSGIPFLQALDDARRMADMNSGWKVFMIKGDSMEPHFGKNSMVVVDKSSFDSLKPGMMVVYQDASGDFVAHRLIEHTNAGWVIKGQNNDRMDPGLVTPGNYQGVIFAVLTYKEGTDQLASVDPAVKPPVALAKRY